MANERLTEANQLHEKIVETKKMIADLQSSYMNAIRAINFVEDREDSSCMIFSRGDELHAIILNHFQQKLRALQEEYESL